jgi:hypothetical protein
MEKVFACILTATIWVGNTAMLAYKNPAARSGTSAEVNFATDGAFRDGLYMGKLAAQRGEVRHPAVDRWSADRDRRMFAAGYRRGYDQFLAAR